MDMLYILGNGSKHDNQELRWSLRSLEKYGRNVGSIAIVGEPPEWLSPEVKTLKTDNHASLVITRDDMLKFISEIGNPYEVVDLYDPNC